MLQKLAGVPHIVTLAGVGKCSLGPTRYHAILVEPFVEALSQDHPPQLFAQVGRDIRYRLKSISLPWGVVSIW